MSKLISEEEKFCGPRFNVIRKTYETDEGKQFLRDIVNPGEASVILPITDNNEVVFEKQFREAVGKVCLELPAGIVEKGEEPIHAAKRELEEETGIIAKSIEHMITIFPSTGYTSEKVHIFLARDFENGKINLDYDEEILDVVKIPMEECLQRVIDGELENASQVIAILLYNKKYMK